ATVGTALSKRATSTIPNVMALVHDPVRSGLVKSLAQPGGNVTGLSMMTTVDLNSKRLQLLKELIPGGLARAAVIWNPDHPLNVRQVEDLKAIAPRLSIDLSFMGGRTREELAPAFSEIQHVKAQTVYQIDDPIFFAPRTTFLPLAAAAQLPTMHDQRRWPEAGALMSYGPDTYDLFRRSATYVDRILKGVKPADLPVEQPTKFELVINVKTAKALGLEVPLTVLYRADEVIESRSLLLRCMSPLMAQSRHGLMHCTCPLSGVKRTSQLTARMSANDPKPYACLTDLKFDTTP